MRRKFGSSLRHSILMVRRKMKTYAAISVTIVLSFSFLLGYLSFSDSVQYNEHKDTFCQRRGDIVIIDYDLNAEKLNAFTRKIGQTDGTNYYIAYGGLGGELMADFVVKNELSDTCNVYMDNWQLFYYPDHAWEAGGVLYTSTDVTWVIPSKSEEFVLAEDECIMNEGAFFALGLNEYEEPVYTFRFELGGTRTLRVVGYVKDIFPFGFEEENGFGVNNINQMILSTKILGDGSGLSNNVHRRYIVIHSEQPELTSQIAEEIGYENIKCVYKEQNEALEAIRSEKRNKAIIACTLLIILGINLYSSFSNAMNDRKFEIGVKRAIGASSWSIVRQFLYESLIVMAANILLSIVLVTDALLVYKYIYEHTPNEAGQYLNWIVYVTPHSIGMFGVCAVTLTVVFSMIFAYKSTQVEIVRYLKAE